MQCKTNLAQHPEYTQSIMKHDSSSIMLLGMPVIGKAGAKIK